MPWDGLFDLLDAGGSAAMIALLLVMWRFDRRLLKIENALFNGIYRRLDRVEKKIDTDFCNDRKRD